MSNHRPHNYFSPGDDSFHIPGWVVFAVFLFVLIAVGVYFHNARERERLRVEEEQAVVRMKEIEAQNKLRQDAVHLIETALDKRQAERQAVREAYERRYQDASRERDNMIQDARDRQAVMAAQSDARRRQLEAENERRQALYELDRQKQWLEQQRREEQYAAERRAYLNNNAERPRR